MKEERRGEERRERTLKDADRVLDNIRNRRIA